MCELFGISSDYPVVISKELNEFRLRGGRAADNPDGWGLAWQEHGTFRIAKEPIPAHQSTLFAQLCSSTRSSLVIAHVRKASFPPDINMSNTHPFQRVCCGKEWVFAHNGMVPDIVDIELSSSNPVCCPTGRTDSEYAFCHLLGHIAQHFHGLPSAAPSSWFENLALGSGLVASLGKFNFLMSDGEHLIAYGHDRLHYLERTGSGLTDGTPLNSVLVATEPLEKNGKWTAFEAGELRVYRSGKLTGRLMTQPMLHPDPERLQP
ncbi:MAG: class II glutamine amidotransferase [Nitrosomonadales bacterium]|nr:class II glutamine amidotransferase [Nitrosomonadales bacterium]